MADKFQYYDTGDDAEGFIYPSRWGAQTFTPEANHTITSIKIKMFRLGNPGQLTFEIRETSGGEPTDVVLCSGTYDGNSITDTSPGQNYEITLGAGASLETDVMYAIVAYGGVDNVNQFKWRMDATDPGYTRGSYVWSNDGGLTWEVQAYDFIFEEWGEAAGAPRSRGFVIG